jgi:hypothetical protein
MSSRQEEKERRRKEREAAEQAAKASAKRRTRLQLVFGAVLVVVLLGAGTALAVGVLGGDDGGTSGGGGDTAAIPKLQEGDLKKAAAAANCDLKENLPNEGRNHEEKEFKASDYKQNPPTSGNHFPEWYQDGEYEPGDTPELGKVVHALEHGRIELQYAPGTPANTVAQLRSVFNEMDDGYHMLLFENGTKMPYAVAMTAWDNMIGCKTVTPAMFDALRDFTKAHIDQGPEVVQ